MQNVDIISKTAIFYLPVDNIAPNPYQPRRSFDVAELKALVASVKQYGIIEPVTVRLIGGGYELVNGQRRLKACKMAGMTEIPAVVVDVSDRDCAVVSAIENLQRENLDYFDQALAFKVIMEDFNYNSVELAQMLCISVDVVEEKLRLLGLSKEVKESVAENGLTQDYAVLIARLEKTEMQREAVKKITEQNMDIRSACKFVEGLKTGQLPKTKIKKYFKDIRLFLNTIKQASEIMCASGMETSYTVEQRDKSYEIKILIRQ